MLLKANSSGRFVSGELSQLENAVISGQTKVKLPLGKLNRGFIMQSNEKAPKRPERTFQCVSLVNPVFKAAVRILQRIVGHIAKVNHPGLCVYGPFSNDVKPAGRKHKSNSCTVSYNLCESKKRGSLENRVTSGFPAEAIDKKMQAVDVRIHAPGGLLQDVSACETLKVRAPEQWKNGLFTNCSYEAMYTHNQTDLEVIFTVDVNKNKLPEKYQTDLPYDFQMWYVNRLLNGNEKRCLTATGKAQDSDSWKFILVAPFSENLCEKLLEKSGSAVDGEILGKYELLADEIQLNFVPFEYHDIYLFFLEELNGPEGACKYNGYWARPKVMEQLVISTHSRVCQWLNFGLLTCEVSMFQLLYQRMLDASDLWRLNGCMCDLIGLPDNPNDHQINVLDVPTGVCKPIATLDHLINQDQQAQQDESSSASPDQTIGQIATYSSEADDYSVWFKQTMDGALLLLESHADSSLPSVDLLAFARGLQSGIMTPEQVLSLLDLHASKTFPHTWKTVSRCRPHLAHRMPVNRKKIRRANYATIQTLYHQ
ncbi:hypothetical protein CLF_108151 [Clonorchis sinensis]|uniref:Uncharacterized protein n=1 Tax=Clonorchis sinensis TaxID=79923 RepID=G7YHQ1_CLOSI|nr:hypothetical protein CLF_108151 [Clonorchis sinensis]